MFLDPVYGITAVVATLCALPFSAFWAKFSREVSALDALGLGVFVCIGTESALSHGLSWWAAAGMGVVTATFGGVLRDVLRNEVPLIFRKEIYATAALFGALIFLGLGAMDVARTLAIPVATVVTAGVRLLAIRYTVNQSSHSSS